MNTPLSSPSVTVQLSADDAADLQSRVERGEFASLEDGVAAELAELNYRRAAEIVGGSDKLEVLLDQLEATDDPSSDVDAGPFFEELMAGLRAHQGRRAGEAAIGHFAAGTARSHGNPRPYRR